jgi:hypothetical protein
MSHEASYFWAGEAGADVVVRFNRKITVASPDELAG